MSPETISLVVSCLEQPEIHTLDITGGAPEMHPQFRELVDRAFNMGKHVIDRCNLTILELEEYQDLSQFMAERQVEIIASLPCYTEDNVDKQRGKGVFEDSIAALKRLNKLNYGMPGSNLKLNLVYNPGGAFLPPSQQELQATYKQQLLEEYGIHFHELYTICNMPIKRFGSTLISKGEFGEYMNLIKGAHRDENLENVMCRNMLSVDWQGYLYDCDFNQMLGLNVMSQGRRKLHLSDIVGKGLDRRGIQVADHCFGCTAGQGSSCGGALS
jgi:radical SAM/Cys-rich protein